MGDPTVLSYGDCLIRKSDVAILNSCQWLNDQIIGFFFEYCQTELFKDSRLSFVGPEVTQFIKIVNQSEIAMFLDPLDIHSQNAIFFAVNSNTNPDLAGGSHWSLLVYLKITNTFHHFDSSRGFNSQAARILAKRLNRYLIPRNEVNLIEADALQQNNGYDCGIHCIVNAEHVANHVKDGYSDFSTLPDIDQLKISFGRSYMNQLISSLAAAQ